MNDNDQSFDLGHLQQAMMMQESGGNPRAVSSKGAIGLMQIMPATGRQYGATPAELRDPVKNLQTGGRIIRDLYQRYDGDIRKVLWGYNAGPRAVERGHMPRETHNYINSILNRLGDAFVGTAYADELPAAMKDAKPIDAPELAPAPETPAPVKPEGESPLPAALEGAKPIADPLAAAAPTAQKPRGFEQIYERQWRPLVEDTVRKLTGAGIGALQSGPGGMEAGFKQPSPTAGTIAHAVTPNTLTEAGIDVGLLTSGLGELGLLTRLALPTIGGVLGAGAQTGSAAPADLAGGAATGLASGVGGELGGALVGAAARAGGAQKVIEGSTEEAAQALSKGLGQRVGMQAAPTTEVPRTSSFAAELENTFGKGRLTDVAGKRAEQISAEASQKLSQAPGLPSAPGNPLSLGRLIDVGTFGPPMSLSEVEETITALNEGAYTATGTARSVQGRTNMVRKAHQLRETTAAQLNQIEPGLGDRWRQSRRDLGASMALQQLFSESQVFSTNRKGIVSLDRNRVASLIRSRKYWNRLNSQLGPEETEHLLDIMRGGEKTPVSDIAATEFHLGLGFSGHPHGSIPRSAVPAGAPALMRPAGRNPARIPIGAAVNALINKSQ